MGKYISFQLHYLNIYTYILYKIHNFSSCNANIEYIMIIYINMYVHLYKLFLHIHINIYIYIYMYVCMYIITEL